PQRTASVDSPIYHADVSSEGGKLLDWTLLYRGKKPMIIVGEFGPQGIALAPSEKAAAAPVPMNITKDALRLAPEKPTDSLVLTGESDGLLVRETLTFDAAAFAYETRVRVENPSAVARTVTVTLPWTTRTDWRGVTEQFLGQHPGELILSSEGRVRHLETLTD